MMEVKHTKKQIIEAIKHWKNVLKKMDESKSPLLDVFAEKFGEDVVFGNLKLGLNDKNANIMFNVLNIFLFENSISNILIKCLEYPDICAFDKAIYDKYKLPDDDEYVNPPTQIYGMHSVIVLNQKFKYDEPLIFANEEVIYLNKSKINNTSFALQLASLCHEMIHCYDKIHGEYQNEYKEHFISQKKLKLHDTPTFEKKMKEAHDNYVNVIKCIPNNQTLEQSDKKAIELALNALKESKDGISCNISKNTPEVQLVGNKRYIMIHDFD